MESFIYLSSSRSDGDNVKTFEELVEKVISDSKIREEFFRDPKAVLAKYEIELTEEELSALKNLEAEPDKLSEELSKRLSKSCSWQT